MKNLKAHKKQYHQEEYKYICTERKCKFRTKEKQVYESHKIRKHGQQLTEAFICEKCNKEFNAKYLLRKHLNYAMCDVKANFICDVCIPSKKFKTSQRLIYHTTKYVHSSKAQKLKCKICYKLFGSKENLKRHTKRHFEQEEKVKKQKAEAEPAEAAKKNKKPKEELGLELRVQKVHHLS